MVNNVLIFSYCFLVTSNRKAVLLSFTTNNLLGDLSYSSTRGFFRPALEDNRYYCAGSKGIKMFNLNDKSKSNVINSSMLEVYYVATSGDKLYYANINTETVDQH
jgi:hypothetical protein